MPFQRERTPFQPWEYRPETGLTGDKLDLTGYPIVAVDGDIGQSTRQPLLGSSYLVVRTGPWIFGRKVLLPAGVVERIDTVEHKVYVDRTKDQIKNSPSSTDSKTTPSIGTGSAAITPRRTTVQTPGCDPGGAGGRRLTPVRAGSQVVQSWDPASCCPSGEWPRADSAPRARLGDGEPGQRNGLRP